MMAPRKVWLITAVGPPPWAMTIDHMRGLPGVVLLGTEGASRPIQAEFDAYETIGGSNSGRPCSANATTPRTKHNRQRIQPYFMFDGQRLRAAGLQGPRQPVPLRTAPSSPTPTHSSPSRPNHPDPAGAAAANTRRDVPSPFVKAGSWFFRETCCGEMNRDQRPFLAERWLFSCG